MWNNVPLCGVIMPFQIGRQHRQTVMVIVCPARLNRHILSFDESGLVQALAEGSDKVRRAGGRRAPEKPDHNLRRRLGKVLGADLNCSESEPVSPGSSRNALTL
jgi:hypothetical protein